MRNRILSLWVGGVSLAGIALYFGLAWAAATTWNPSDKDASITLSGGNLIATATTANAWRGVRATTSFAVGGTAKKVFQVLVTAGTNGWIGGIADSSQSLTGVLGASGVSLGIEGPIGNQFASGLTTGASCGGPASGMTSIWIAVDFASGKIWCERNTCVNWNSTNNGNPGTGANPAYTVTSGTPSLFIAWSGFDNESDKATISPTPDISSCTNLSGFTQWDPPVATRGSGWTIMK